MPFVLGQLLCNLPHRGHCDHDEATCNVLANDVGNGALCDMRLAHTVDHVLENQLLILSDKTSRNNRFTVEILKTLKH